MQVAEGQGLQLSRKFQAIDTSVLFTGVFGAELTEPHGETKRWDAAGHGTGRPAAACCGRPPGGRVATWWTGRARGFDPSPLYIIIDSYFDSLHPERDPHGT